MARRATKQKTLRDLRVDAYRAAIRQAAERVFAERGFAGAHVGQIAKEAGVSVGTIYRVYPGRKPEIYQDLQTERGKEALENTRARGLAAFQRRGDVLDAMLEGLGALVEYFIAHPDYLRIVLSEEKAWALALRKTATQAANWKQGMSGSEEGIWHGIATGQIVDDGPEVMARTLVAMQQAHLGILAGIRPTRARGRGRRSPPPAVPACVLPVGRRRRARRRCGHARFRAGAQTEARKMNPLDAEHATRCASIIDRPHPD